MVAVEITDEFRAWYDSLTAEEQAPVAEVVGLLEGQGVTLGDPYSSAIKGSKCALRELRAGHRRQEFRVFYAFDPKRQAILLLGGDKSGDAGFYARMIPRAERLWEVYLAEIAEEQAADERKQKRKGKK